MRKSIFSQIIVLIVLLVLVFLIVGIFFKTNVPNNNQIIEKDKFIEYAPPAGSFSVLYPKIWQLRLLGNDGTEFKNPATGSYLSIDTTIGSDVKRDSIDDVIENMKKMGDFGVKVGKTISRGNTRKEFEFEVNQPKLGKGKAIVICCVNKNQKTQSDSPSNYYMLLQISYSGSDNEESNNFKEILDSFKIMPLDWDKLYN